MLTLPEFEAVLMQLGARFGASMNAGRLDWDAVKDAIWELLLASPITAGLDPDHRAELADRIGLEASRVATNGPIAAIHDIRDALQPLMANRRPRATLLLAGYRVANGRLSAREVEDCVNAETVYFMRRITALKAAAK